MSTTVDRLPISNGLRFIELVLAVKFAVLFVRSVHARVRISEGETSTFAAGTAGTIDVRLYEPLLHRTGHQKTSLLQKRVWNQSKNSLAA